MCALSNGRSAFEQTLLGAFILWFGCVSIFWMSRISSYTIITGMKYSLYLHIPFCTHRCAYCDFNTYAGQEDMIPAYVEALCKEIEFAGRGGSRSAPTVHTIFFGGGTPSLLSPPQFDSIFKSIRSAFTLTPDCRDHHRSQPGNGLVRRSPQIPRDRDQPHQLRSPIRECLRVADARTRS